MHANRVAQALLLLVAAPVLAACGKGGKQPAQEVPTPTLITPAALPSPSPEEAIEEPPTPTPQITPTPEATPTLEATATPAGPGTHQVAQGEWVYAIARAYGVSPQDIIAANPGLQSNPDLIFPDQQLVIPGGGPSEGGATEVPPPTPTPGAPSLPVIDRSVYEALLAESLPPLAGGSCAVETASRFVMAWGQEKVAPRLGCASAEAIEVTGTWLEFGPGSRIIWLRELGEFHAITGDGFGQRWVFADGSGLADAPPQLRPGVASSGYTPTEGRFAWLLGEYPEVASIFSPAFGDENVIAGEYQRFENGAMLFDGALKFVFFDDAGPWWYLAE